MYDDFSDDYDRFVNWAGRLAHELPFIQSQLSLAAAEGARLLDAACGTGMHAIALAQRGYTVTGADYSAGMIRRARQNAQEQAVHVEFITAGFGQLASLVPIESFDALLCLGNSLPHVSGAAELRTTLADFAACLRPDGLLLLQNRNFDLVLAQGERWMEPQAHQSGAEHWLFLRFYDFLPDGAIQFNILSLHQNPAGVWEQRIHSTRLYPLLQDGLVQALQSVGFQHITAFGGLDGSAFNAAASGNLVLTARKG